MIAALLLAATAALAEGSAKTELSQDVTVRAKAAGPSLAVPPPSASKPVVDEVLRSLSLGRGSAGPSPETIRVTPESARLSRPFPESPYLALSPQNIRALYDSWTFEIGEVDGEIMQKSEGVGLLRESIDWDGSGPDGRLALVPGRSYKYRFTGRRGAREFTVESDPILINSFTRRDYGGETRMEVALSEIFVDESAKFATGAERYLDRICDALRAGDARSDGTYRFELATKQPRAKLSADRAKALVKAFSSALLADPAKVKVAPMPAERGESLSAFVPPAKGARLRIE
jgi:hypothetical protein